MSPYLRYQLVQGLLLLAGFVTAAAAQSSHHVNRGAAEVLAAYVQESQAVDTRGAAGLDLMHMLTYPDAYPPSDIELLLKGLEDIAVNGKPAPLRAEAAFRLGVPGSNRSRKPLPGVFSRLARVYRKSEDPVVRSVLIAAIGDLTDRREALAFLERVAAQPVADFPGAAGRALASLLMMGDEGRVVLKRLHETKAVHDPETRADLSTLAKHGFRLP